MPEFPEFVRQRLEQAAGGNHPDANLLAAFAENALSQAERLHVLEHLGACALCRDVAALASPPPAPSAAGTKESARIPWLRWPILRWAAAAAAVVIVAAAVSLRRGELARVAVDQRVADRVSHADGNAGSASANGAAPLQDLRVKEQPSLQDGRQKKVASSEAKNTDSLNAPATPRAPVGPPRQPINADRLQTNETGAFAFKKQIDKKLDAGVGGVAVLPGASGKDAAATTEPQSAPGAPVIQQKLPTSSQAVSSEVAGYGPSQKQTNQAPAPPPSAEAKAKVESAEATPVTRADAGQLQQQTEEARLADLSRDEPSPKKSMGRALNTLRRTSATTSWRVSTEGALEQSVDGGGTWRTVPVRTSVGLSEASYILSGFRAVSALGQEVWAAGARGAVYRSDNGGLTWTRVMPKTGDRLLLADVVRVVFIDPQHGTLTTDNGEVWATADGGASWSVRRP